MLPAGIVVDLQVGFTDPVRSTLAGDLAEVIAASNRVVAAARKAGAPVIHTVVGYDSNRPEDAGLWAKKAPSLFQLALGGPMVELDSRSEEHTSELQSLMRISYAVFCLQHTTNKY